MRYKIIKKRLMSALLMVILLMSLIPTTAFAATAADTSTQPETKPDQPVTAGFSIVPAVDGNGRAAAIIPERSVDDVITKALDNAKLQGKSAKGIGVAFNISLPDAAGSLRVDLTQAVLKRLVDTGIKHLEVNGTILTLNLDLEAIKAIQKQSMGDAAINISTSPVYNITISYVNNGKTEYITDLGSGTAAVGIPGKSGLNAAPFIPGGYDGKQNSIAAPFIPGGLDGRQNDMAAPFIPGGQN